MLHNCYFLAFFEITTKKRYPKHKKNTLQQDLPLQCGFWYVTRSPKRFLENQRPIDAARVQQFFPNAVRKKFVGQKLRGEMFLAPKFSCEIVTKKIFYFT